MNLVKYVDSNIYIDARIKVLDCCFFGDEVVLIHEYKHGKDIRLHFSECCNVMLKFHISCKTLKLAKRMRHIIVYA